MSNQNLKFQDSFLYNLVYISVLYRQPFLYNLDEPGKLNHLRRIKLSRVNEVLGFNPSDG